MKMIQLKPQNQIERKILNLRYEWISGINERLKELIDEINFYIKVNEEIKERNNELLKDLRNHSNEENLNLLENLIILKEISFSGLEKLRRRIVNAAQL